MLVCCLGRDGEGRKTRGGASFLPLMQRRSSIYSLVPRYVIEQQRITREAIFSIVFAEFQLFVAQYGDQYCG